MTKKRFNRVCIHKIQVTSLTGVSHEYAGSRILPIKKLGLEAHDLTTRSEQESGLQDFLNLTGRKRIPMKTFFGLSCWTIQSRLAWPHSARMKTTSCHDRCHRALPPIRLREAPADLSLFSQRVRMKLTTSTQGYTSQRLARGFVLRPSLHDEIPFPFPFPSSSPTNHFIPTSSPCRCHTCTISRTANLCAQKNDNTRNTASKRFTSRSLAHPPPCPSPHWSPDISHVPNDAASAHSHNTATKNCLTC